MPGALPSRHTAPKASATGPAKPHISSLCVSNSPVESLQAPLTGAKANRNKKSVGVSFQTPQGRDILHSLAKKCDVLVENYLPGGLKKYGMDYETLRKINPSLVYASITGYGHTGPYSDRAGYDVMVEA